MRQRLIARVVLVIGCGVSLMGCASTSETWSKINPFKSGETTASSTPESKPYQSTQPLIRKPAAKKPSGGAIAALGNNTFRFKMEYEDVWNTALTVLLNNYNITTLDKDSGVVTTEWDTYYLNERVYRNKISLRLKRTAWNVIDVLVYNNVETLAGGDAAKANAIWLPASQSKKEVGRIIQNMALAMNQPAPAMPQEMMATMPTAPATNNPAPSNR